MNPSKTIPAEAVNAARKAIRNAMQGSYTAETLADAAVDAAAPVIAARATAAENDEKHTCTECGDEW